MKRALAGIAAVALTISVGACSSESEPYNQQQAFEGAYVLLTSLPKFAGATETEAHQLFREVCKTFQAGKDAGMTSDEVLVLIGVRAGLSPEEALVIGGGAIASSCVSLRDWVD